MPAGKAPAPGDREAVNHIRNKLKRQEVYGRIKKQKNDIKKQKKEQKKKDAEDPEKANQPKNVPKTLDNMREADETVVVSDDEEIARDEEEDEFRRYFDGEQPKTIITTQNRPSKSLIEFVKVLLQLLPGSYYYARKHFDIKDICAWSTEKGFTNLIILGQGLQLGGHRKNPCSLLLVHLPEGNPPPPPPQPHTPQTAAPTRLLRPRPAAHAPRPARPRGRISPRLAFVLHTRFAQHVPPPPPQTAR